MNMDAWEPTTLKNLSTNHTVIIFDNRGVENTTTGTKPFSIQQFANDTSVDSIQSITRLMNITYAREIVHIFNDLCLNLH